MTIKCDRCQMAKLSFSNHEMEKPLYSSVISSKTEWVQKMQSWSRRSRMDAVDILQYQKISGGGRPELAIAALHINL